MLNVSTVNILNPNTLYSQPIAEGNITEVYASYPETTVVIPVNTKEDSEEIISTSIINDTNASEVELELLEKNMYVNKKTNVLNLPLKDSEVLKTLETNEEVYVIHKDSYGFCLVEYEIEEEKIIGYINENNLSLEKVSSASNGPSHTVNDDYKLQVIIATVRHEGGNSYEGAHAVMSCVMNRVDSGRWGGTDAYSIIVANGQFESYFEGRYEQFMDYNVSEDVIRAVNDCLSGQRSHSYQSFRTYSDSAVANWPHGENICGNWYF